MTGSSSSILRYSSEIRTSLFWTSFFYGLHRHLVLGDLHLAILVNLGLRQLQLLVGLQQFDLSVVVVGLRLGKIGLSLLGRGLPVLNLLFLGGFQAAFSSFTCWTRNFSADSASFFRCTSANSHSQMIR